MGTNMLSGTRLPRRLAESIPVSSAEQGVNTGHRDYGFNFIKPLHELLGKIAVRIGTNNAPLYAIVEIGNAAPHSVVDADGIDDDDPRAGRQDLYDVIENRLTPGYGTQANRENRCVQRTRRYERQRVRFYKRDVVPSVARNAALGIREHSGRLIAPDNMSALGDRLGEIGKKFTCPAAHVEHDIAGCKLKGGASLPIQSRECAEGAQTHPGGVDRSNALVQRRLPPAHPLRLQVTPVVHLCAFCFTGLPGKALG
jgi:hypothetical protein